MSVAHGRRALDVPASESELTAAEQRRVRRQVSAHRRSVARKALPYCAAFVVALAAVGFGLLWSRGWLPGMFAPSKLVVRGCELTDAARIVTLMECDGTQAVPALWTRARAVKKSEERWLRGIGVHSDWGRSAVIEVSERRPLLQLMGAAFPYWLCDDGMLIPKQQNDRGEVFAAIAGLPRISLPEDPGEGRLKDADTYLQLVAACDRYLPGQIGRIELTREGEVNLYQHSGFEIRLGSEDLAERIAALPQVLRVCEDHKDRLRYIYATEVNGTLVFYEKWKGPAKSLAN